MVILPTKRFAKQFKKLSTKRKSQFFEKIEVFKNKRSEYILQDHALHQELEGFRSFSVTGGIRVVYKVLEDDVVQFIQIGTHSQLYE